MALTLSSNRPSLEMKKSYPSLESRLSQRLTPQEKAIYDGIIRQRYSTSRAPIDVTVRSEIRSEDYWHSVMRERKFMVMRHGDTMGNMSDYGAFSDLIKRLQSK